MSGPWRRVERGLEITIRLTPKSSRDRILGVAAGALRVAVTAAPSDGVANEALLRYLGKALHLPYSSLALLRGATSRSKTVLLQGEAEVLEERVRNLIQQH